MDKLFETHKKTLISIKALIVGFPTVLLAYSQYTAKEPLPLQSMLKEYFSEHFVILMITVAWPFLSSIAFSFMSDWFDYFSPKSRNQKLYLTSLLASLGDVVGKKMHRFGTYVKKFNKGELTREEIFDKITQPEKQIEHLIVNLYNLIKTITLDDSIQIILVGVENNIPKSYICFMPNDNVPPVNLTGEDAKKTFFQYSIDSKKPVFIKDIESFLKLSKSKRKKTKIKYIPSNNSDEDIGSLICYPIIQKHLERTIYVLSLKSKNPNQFNEAFKTKYSLYIFEYTKRLVLEYNLHFLKNGGLK